MAVKGVSTPAVFAAGAGALFLWSGIGGKDVSRNLRSLLSAKPRLDSANVNPITGSAAAAASTTPAGGVPSPAGNPGAVNGCTAAQTAQNRALGRLMAGAYGWGAGAQWDALDTMIGTQESGWCNVAQNPGSTAYGIGQFLDTTWPTVGYTKTSDPVVQIAAMLAYIRQRYGNPVAAEQFHLQHGWY